MMQLRRRSPGILNFSSDQSRMLSKPRLTGEEDATGCEDEDDSPEGLLSYTSLYQAAFSSSLMLFQFAGLVLTGIAHPCAWLEGGFAWRSYPEQRLSRNGKCKGTHTQRKAHYTRGRRTM